MSDGPAISSLRNTLVLFDWNGTLVLDRTRAHDALNGVLRSRSLSELDRHGFERRFRLPLSAMFVALGVAAGDADAAESEWNVAMASVAARLRTGVVEALDALGRGGARIGVVTAAASGSLASDLRRLDLVGRFDSIDAAVADKPAVLRERRNGATHAFYVGDTVYDMHSATASGYVPIGVTDGYASVRRLSAAGAAAIVGDVRELIGLLDAARAG